MTGTMGREAMNFINPDLMWKPVAKGCRTGSRRPKKSVARSSIAGAELSDKATGEVVDKVVSDTEKHGVAVLGRRFSVKSDNVEHVPIKKRRLMLPSPLPQFQTPFPAANSSTKNRFCQKISEVNSSKFDDGDSFSGIEILATVACSNSMIDDVYNDEGSSLMDEMTRGVDSSTSAVLFEENAAASRDLACEDRTKASSFVESSEFTISQKYPSVKDVREMDGNSQSRDSRLHWDLNVPMDAWDLPCDMLSADSQVNSVENNFKARNDEIQMLDSCDIEGECKNSGHNPFDSSDSCKCVQSPTDNSRETSISDITGAKASSKIAGKDACLDQSACPAVSEENPSASPSGHNIKLSTECVQDVSPHMAELQRDTCEIDCTILNDGQISRKASQSHEDNESIREAISLVGCQPEVPVLLGDEPKNEAEKPVEHDSPPNNGGSSASGVFAVEGHLVNIKGTDDEASMFKTCDDSSMDAVSRELMQKSSTESDITPREACSVHDGGPPSSLANVTMDDHSDNSYESDGNQDVKIPMVGVESTTQLNADYDSQFEDGEFRESDSKYCWDENEDEDGEVEHVDYGSDFEEEWPCDVDNMEEQKDERGSGPVADDITRKIDHCGTTDAPIDESTSSKTKTLDVTADKGLQSGVGGSRTSYRKLLSCIKGSEEICREGTTMRSSCTSVCRDEMGSDRDAYHMHGRTPGGRYFVNASAVYWDLERHPSHTYHGRKPKYVEGRGHVTSAYHRDLGAKEYAEFDDHVYRQFVNSSYKGAPTRTRSPSNRSDPYGMHRTLPVGDISPMNNGFRRYPQHLDRGGLKGGYYRTSRKEKDEYPNRVAHRMARRERSISPFNGRKPDYTLTFKKSHSRSRSRSPASYFPARERIQNSRLRSRSPDFKSDARKSRVRLSFAKPFASGDEGFISPTKGLQRNNRSFEDRYGAVDNFRGRKSPVRMIRPSQRSEWNSHDHFKPLKQARKFSDNGGSVEGGEYRGSHYTRKPSSRFDMVHRMRHHERTGIVRQFHFNAEKSFVVNDSAERRPREALRRRVTE